MALTLYYHPLSSFCQKVIIALYENETPFTPHLVDFRNEDERAVFLKLWPIGKFPVLHDSASDRTIPESSVIIEYLAQHFPGKAQLVPQDADAATQMRLQDRLFDLYVNMPMQAVVGNRRRPADMKDAYGVEQARHQLVTAYGILDADLTSRTWACGETFTMADCAAAPALYYANRVLPFEKTHRNLAAYFERLRARPSYARAFKESEPYLHFFPE
jgi:glutathione S-transferase